MLPEVEEKLKPVFEEFRKKMREQGYSETSIEMALKRAKDRAEGISMTADARHPELVRSFQIETIPEELESSEKYLLGLYGVFAPKTTTIYGRKYWEDRVSEALKEKVRAEVIG